MIVKLSQLSKLREDLKNKKIIFAGGTFDLFHRGHVEYLKHLRTLGDILVVAVSSDKRVRQRKGPGRPVLLQKDRLALVDSVRYVDYAFLAPEPSKSSPIPTMKIIAMLKPDIFVTCDNRWAPFQKDIAILGSRLKLIPRIHITSTTSIIHRIITRHCVIKKCIHYRSQTRRDH